MSLEAIDSLLSESLASARRREAKAFGDELSGNSDGGVIFGAGRLGRLCARALDGLFTDSVVTFIKFDIEGAGHAALHEAKELLNKHKPLMAFGCYHLLDHLWTIPQCLRQHLPAHCHFLRCHRYDGWEMVHYAVPIDRLKVL